jgi:hypothetical protein
MENVSFHERLQKNTEPIIAASLHIAEHEKRCLDISPSKVCNGILHIIYCHLYPVLGLLDVLHSSFLAEKYLE